MPQPPTFATSAEERLHRKQQLAGAFRIFGRFGFGEGIAGHITVRDPEDPHMFWVNPFGMSFRHIRVSDLIAVNHEGDVVHGNKPVNQAGLRHPLRGARRPPGRRGRRARALGVRQGVVLARAPARPDHPGRLHALREPRRGHRGPRRRRARPRGRQGARRRADRPQDGVPPEPRDLQRRARPSPRPRGGSSTPSATARPSCSPRPPGRRRRSTTRTRSSPPSRPAPPTPAGSRSSRCGTRSCARTPTCSTDVSCVRFRAMTRKHTHKTGGRMIVDAHVHVAHLARLKVSWDQWMGAAGDAASWAAMYDDDGAPIPAGLSRLLRRGGRRPRRCCSASTARRRPGGRPSRTCCRSSSTTRSASGSSPTSTRTCTTPWPASSTASSATGRSR